MIGKKNFEPLEVRHQNIFQGYYVVDRTNGYNFKQVEINGDIEPELFSTKEKAKEAANKLNEA